MNESMMFWAKLGKETWPEKYHPVVCHLIDVGQVARRMWDDVCRHRIRKWVTARLGLPNEDATGAWLAFWVAAHDIGKISPCFQNRGKTNELHSRLLAKGFDFPMDDEPHGTISTKVLVDELIQLRGWSSVSDAISRNVAVAVGGHHGMFPLKWDQMCNPLGNEKWAAARRDLLLVLGRLFGVSETQGPNPPESNDKSVWMYVAGLTSVADWVGSNKAFFQDYGNKKTLDARPFDVNRYFRRADIRARRALKRLGWLGRVNSCRNVSMSDFLPKKAVRRPLQEILARIVSDMPNPGLLIVEAPMGEGKTEAGWFAAASWERGGGQGSYVALPTMATSNQMFERVEKFLENSEGKSNLQLLHGKAALNDKFEKMKFAAELYDDRIEDGKKPSAVVAEGWFAANKKQALLAPYGVGTIDQILLAVLQTKHVFVRLFGLAGKCVILDEVHAYDTYMTTLMERLLRWLSALGCSVVLLSATLPKAKRLALLNAYAGDDTPEPKEELYPRITSVTVGGKPEVTHVNADKKKAVRLQWVAEDNLIELLRGRLANGGCAAVIRNTVGLAQRTYAALREGLTPFGITVELFHARFPFGRRMQIENDVLDRYGKGGGPGDRNKHVLVATQVIEQSLDLDFDMMISDVAPVDLVLQRAGRLHRHVRGDDRPADLREPTLWLIEPVMEDGQPDFGPSEFVYSEYILFRSLLALRGDTGRPRETIQLPGEIDVLIEKVYSEDSVFENLTPTEQQFWKDAKAIHEKKQTIEQDEAEGRQIKKPRFRGALARVIGEPREEDSPDLHPAHQALTRLASPTAQLICLIQDSSGARSMIHDGALIPAVAVRKMSEGGVRDVRRLLLAELATAHPGVVRELWKHPRTPKEWKRVGMLQHHHLIAFIDGCAQVGKYELSLDNQVGLTIVRTDRKEEDE